MPKYNVNNMLVQLNEALPFAATQGPPQAYDH